MIFIRNKNNQDIKKVVDQDYMFSFFKKNKDKFIPAKEKLKKIKIHLDRNFRDRFINMTLRYELITDQKTRIFRARTHKYQDIPEREWKVLRFLKEKGLDSFIPPCFFYYSPLNILFYLEIPGKSFEEIFPKKEFSSFLKVTPKIARALKKIHVKKGPDLPFKKIAQEKKERKHWFFLMQKCGQPFYKRFSSLLKDLWQIRKNYSEIFLKPEDFRLVHSDFHWGNIIKSEENFYFIDFSYAFYGDPLEDIGGFLAQNDSMFTYHAPNYYQEKNKIKEIFIKEYFSRKITKKEKIRLLYFETQKILEMAAVLSFIEMNEYSKGKGVTRLLERATRRLNKLKKIVCQK